MNPTHYVCPECKTESKYPGTCQNVDCGSVGTTLKECHCEDGEHASIGASLEGDESSEPRSGGIIDLDGSGEEM